ncbi:MAG: hypothetical protein ACXABY_31150, partial [Candidatus Thorarchaeota archaeon]
SEINNKALFATISKIQSDITPYVLDTIRRMGYDIDGMIIEFNTRYATDALEQAQIDELRSRTRLNEAQAEGGDFRIGLQMEEGLKDPDKENNPAGRQ